MVSSRKGKKTRGRASRLKACKAVKKYCKHTRCHKKNYRSSTKYRKKICGHTIKMCKYTTCNAHRVVKK